MRPDWDSYWLGVAFAVALRADCSRRKAGAVIVDPFNRIVSTGYNGAPSGLPGCLTAGACPRGRLNTAKPGEPYTGAQACIAVHAEANALLHGDATRYRGGTIYVVSLAMKSGVHTLHESQAPCDGCATLIAGGGVLRTVTPDSLST